MNPIGIELFSIISSKIQLFFFFFFENEFLNKLFSLFSSFIFDNRWFSWMKKRDGSCIDESLQETLNQFSKFSICY